MGTVSLLFIACIAGIIAAFVHRQQLDTSLKTAIQNGVRNYEKNPDTRDAMDLLQKHIGCCGVTSYEDYLNRNSTTVKNSVPKSCCKAANDCQFEDIGKGLNATSNAGIYTTGCYTAVLNEAESAMWVIGGIVGGILIFQMMDLLAAFKLLKIFKANYEQFK